MQCVKMSSLDTEHSSDHVHCDSCIRTNCMNKTACALVYCQASCGARFHSCKEDDHRNICLKEKVPCINKQYGCPREMCRETIPKHLSVCPANIILCKHEWNRWPMHSHDEGWKAPMPFKNPRIRCGQFDVAFALRDQKVLMDSFRLPRKTRRILRNPITWHYPAVPIHSHATLMDSSTSETSQLSDDDTGTPWDLNRSPPGLQRTISNQLASDKHLYEASKKATESLTKALDYVTGKAGLKRLAEIAKQEEVARKDLEQSEVVSDLESCKISGSSQERACDTLGRDVSITDQEEDEFDIYGCDKKLYQILGLDLTMHFISSYQVKPARMYTFICGQEFRRNEYAWHDRNIHSDIQANLNHWFEQRCPLSYAGCTFSFQRFKPKIPPGAIVHSPILHSFGLAAEGEFEIDKDHVSGKLTDEEDVRTLFGRNRLREATPEIHTSCKCDSTVKVIPRYRSVSRETSPVKNVHSEHFHSLTDLPFEILQNIARQLDSFSIQHLSMTCRLLQSVCCSLLDECGLVSLVWEKRSPEKGDDGSPMWDVAYKCWRFSVGFTPILAWRFSDDSPSALSKHLAECEFNQSSTRNIAAAPTRLVYSVQECEGISRQELMRKKRATRKMKTFHFSS